ncbi:MAG: acyl-CoA thioesterase [Firmicutes bacterium]|nr:acyl-CoA thioesterase [Alicyclobacillaceae bacterium]MCL6497336.1 acyl-CoA thioesterase [Bacillota bacterium]
MAVSIDEPVMFRDTDATGIGHYLGMLRFLERGEYALMEAIGVLNRSLLQERYHFPRVHLSVNYRHPIRFGDRLRVRTWVQRIGTTSYTLGMEVTNPAREQLCFDAEITVVVVDPETMRPVPIPEPLRAALAQHLAG